MRMKSVAIIGAGITGLTAAFYPKRKGVPVKVYEAGAHCFKTEKLFVEKAGVPAQKWSVSFQSRLGKDPWLKPYTDFEPAEFPKRGIKRLLVICPALSPIAWRRSKKSTCAGANLFFKRAEKSSPRFRA
jgi:Ferrochelatase/NAD(P)-binding Rossmann-like domain